MKLLSCSIAVGITMFLVGVVFYFLVPVLFPDMEQQYSNASLFRPWTEWTSTYMLFHPFLYGPVFAAIFLALRKVATFPAGSRGGLLYGLGVFVVGSLPVFVLAYASFQVSREILGLWILQNVCQYVAAGMAVGSVADGMMSRDDLAGRPGSALR